MSSGLRRTVVLAVGVLAGCSADNSSTPAGAPASIVLSSGDAQFGTPTAMLSAPLSFKVLDRNGHAVAGTPVVLTVTLGGGTVPAPSLITSDSGVVSTTWTLGQAGGIEELTAAAGSAPIAVATARNCSSNECYPSNRVEGPLSAAAPLALVTYEGSGEAVHPDVVAGHGALRGFWLLVTPYPNGNVDVENPSIFHSDNGTTWTVPAGVANPLAHPGALISYLSDPDALYNPTDQKLWVFYRGANASTNVISVIHSADGSHWDAPTVLLQVPAHEAVSPTIVRGAPHAPWAMWTVNSGGAGCTAPLTTIERRTSGDGLTWGAPVAVTLTQPGQSIWHLDVEWISARHEYWAIYNTYPIGTSCATQSLYLARSTDGLHWTTYPSPIARAGLTPALRDIIYRSSVMVDPAGTHATLWISGANFNSATGQYIWTTSSISTTVDELLALVAAPMSSIRQELRRPDLPPPEPDGIGP